MNDSSNRMVNANTRNFNKWIQISSSHLSFTFLINYFRYDDTFISIDTTILIASLSLNDIRTMQCLHYTRIKRGQSSMFHIVFIMGPSRSRFSNKLETIGNYSLYSLVMMRTMMIMVIMVIIANSN